MLFLEEDLAVGLMAKLLFVPLFHDLSLVGRLLSFVFRSLRILMGVFAMCFATVVLAIGVGYWFLLPIFIFMGPIKLISLITIFCGLGFLLIHELTTPFKKVWQVKDGNFWACSQIKKKNLSLPTLLKNYEVNLLLNYLEVSVDDFKNFGVPDLDKISQDAFEIAKKSGSFYITPVHFFVSYIQNISGIEQYLVKFGLKVEDFQKAVNYLEKRNRNWRRVFIWDEDFTVRHLRGINRGWLGTPTPALDSVSTDLTKLAARTTFDDFVGRQSLVTQAMDILSKEGSQNLILVGESGSGKTTLIKFLAKQILKGDAHPALATKRLVALDIIKLLSGVNAQGELADRIKNIFDEINFAGNIILVVEEIHNLGIGEVGKDFNLYSLMSSYLDSSSFQFIATTEAENYTRILEKNSAFARLFTKLEVPPASVDDTINILEDKAINTERKIKCRVSFRAIKEAVFLSHRFVHDRVLPDSAISVLQQAETKVENGWVTSKTIEQVISNTSHVPQIETDEKNKQELLNLEEEIHKQLINQQEAVKAVSDSLRRLAAGLKEENHPIGSFLFVGPTGVGKTELAKALAKVYFKDEKTFIRLDMSEYQAADAVGRLIGSSDNQMGQLTEVIKNKPYALILLDEFEKASPNILNLFLQVLDDGRLTDFSGKLIDFTNTIIVATSNAASLLIAQGLEKGESIEQLKAQVSEELLKVFKPELVNRFDEVVIFKPLSEEDLQKVVILKLASLKNQLKEEGFLVEFDNGLIAKLAKRGFDKVLGARPLRRLIQDTLEVKLSKMILENQLQKGTHYKAGVEFL